MYHKEGGFSLLLPAGWTVSEPQQAPLGSVYELGPAPPAVGDPGNSTLVVADAKATRLAHVQRAGQPPWEWAFGERGGTLIFLFVCSLRGR